jgi:hypothetical protein
MNATTPPKGPRLPRGMSAVLTDDHGQSWLLAVLSDGRPQVWPFEAFEAQAATLVAPIGPEALADRGLVL